MTCSARVAERADVFKSRRLFLCRLFSCAAMLNSDLERSLAIVVSRYYPLMPRNPKSRPELPLLPPIDFHPPSNGEFWPLPPSLRALEAMRRWLLMVEEKHRRLGMTRREFANSACGYAAALLALNQVSCSSERSGTGSAPSASTTVGPGPQASPGCGMPNGMSGGLAPSGVNAVPSMPGGGSSVNPTSTGMTGTGGGSNRDGGVAMPGRDAGIGSTPSSGSSGGSALDAGFMVTENMTEDLDAATEMMAGNEFIFDVQTHTSTEIAEPWDRTPPDERALDFITQIFVQSETDVAVLSDRPTVAP